MMDDKYRYDVVIEYGTRPTERTRYETLEQAQEHAKREANGGKLAEDILSIMVQPVDWRYEEEQAAKQKHGA